MNTISPKPVWLWYHLSGQEEEEEEEKIIITMLHVSPKCKNKHTKYARNYCGIIFQSGWPWKHSEGEREREREREGGGGRERESIPNPAEVFPLLSDASSVFFVHPSPPIVLSSLPALPSPLTTLSLCKTYSMCKTEQKQTTTKNQHSTQFHSNVTVKFPFCPLQHRNGVSNDCTRLSSNRCDFYKMAKAVHGNQLDNHCNQSNTWPSIKLQELYYKYCASKEVAPFLV